MAAKGRNTANGNTRRGGGATGLTTTHPSHAVAGGLSLLILPLGGFTVLPLLGSLALWLGAHENGMQAYGYVLGGALIALSYVLFDQARARHRWEQRRAAISIGWLGLVFGWGVGAGPSKWWVGAELVGGIALGLWWFFVKTEPVRGTGTDARPDDGGAWSRAVGLNESARPVKVKDEADERHVTVEHTDDTHEDVVKAAKKMEAKAKLPVGSIRVEPVLDGARKLAHRSRLVISRTGYLENGIGKWAGPYQPGALVSDPLRVGWCADRKESTWVMTPTEKTTGSPALLSSGQSGAAKTAFQMNLLGELVARQGVVLWANDTRKAGQWVPFVRPFIDWFEVTPEGARAQLQALARIVPERTELITELTGEDRWTPICWTEFSVPFLVLWLAEAAPLGGMLEEELVRGVEVWRSAGIKVIGEWQRPSEENISTDFRNLIPESMAFRVGKPEDGRMALAEGTLDAGAEPWSISPDTPGVHYAELANEPESRRGMRRRTEEPDRLRVAAAVAEWMTTHPEWHRLDERTAKVAGGAYAAREVATVASWIGSRWGKPPQLRDPSVMTWVDRAKDQAKEQVKEAAPARPVPAPEPQEEPMAEHEEAPDLATAEYEQPDDPAAEDQEVAMETARVMEEVDAEVLQEEGPDAYGDDVLVGDVHAAVAELEEPVDGEDDPDIDFSPPPQQHPRPSPQQRAENFQALVRRLFTDPGLRREDSDLRAETKEQIDGRWVVAGTETIAAIWLDFPGEDVRPGIYPRLRAFQKRGDAKQLKRGRWAISERALTSPLLVADDYDPDATDPDPDEDPDEAANQATERDLAEALS